MKNNKVITSGTTKYGCVVRASSIMIVPSIKTGVKGFAVYYVSADFDRDFVLAKMSERMSEFNNFKKRAHDECSERAAFSVVMRALGYTTTEIGRLFGKTHCQVTYYTKTSVSYVVSKDSYFFSNCDTVCSWLREIGVISFISTSDYDGVDEKINLILSVETLSNSVFRYLIDDGFDREMKIIRKNIKNIYDAVIRIISK